MRKFAFIVTLLLSIVMVTSVLAAPAPKDSPLKVMINGKSVNLKPTAFQRGDKIYLPLEATAKEVKATVKFDKVKNLYTVTSGKNSTIIQASQVVKAGGVAMVTLDLATKALNCNANWGKSSKCVSLTVKGQTTPAPRASGGG